MQDNKQRAPWTFKMPDADLGRVSRAAAILGFASGGRLEKSALIRAGLDALVIRAARVELSKAGGLGAALAQRRRNLCQTLIDVAATMQGDEARIVEALGLTHDEWALALAHFEELRAELSRQRPKRFGVVDSHT